MNSLSLIELFLENCEDGFYIRGEHDDEDVLMVDYFTYEIEDNNLNITIYGEIIRINNIIEVVEYDDLLEIHNDEEIIYIEMI